MQKLVDLKSINDYVGEDLGSTDWILIDQSLINSFAENTFDHQYIHVDPDRARSSPLGSTIAHGMLALSFIPGFIEQQGICIEGTAMTLNYGFDKVRFLTPVPVDSRVRGALKLLDFVEKREGQFQLKYEVAIEIEGFGKPALVAESLVLLMS